MSVRKTIINELVARLQTITTGNGYNTTVQEVSKTVLTPEQVKNHPTLNLIIGYSPYAYSMNDCMSSGVNDGNMRDGWLVGVAAHVSVIEDLDNPGNLIDAVEDMACDVIKCIASHTWTERAVQIVTLYGIDPYYTHETNNGVVHIIFSIKYDFDPTNP